MEVIVNLVHQAAVSVLIVNAPNSHIMPTSSKYGNILIVISYLCVFSLSVILSGTLMIWALPLHFHLQKSMLLC